MRIYVDFDDCLCETAKSFSDLADDNGDPISSETEYVEEIKNRAYTHVTLLCL